MIKTLSILILLGVTNATALGADGDQYSISTSNGLEMTPNSKRAKIFSANEDLWDFRSFDLELRISARQLGDTPIDETTIFGARNTLLFFYTDVDGKRTRVGCDGGDEPTGWVKRTELTATHVAGAFQVDMIECRNFYSGEGLDLEILPIQVEGVFSVQRKSFP